MNIPTRPALRWHGGKWVLAPRIIEHMPAHRVYIEPFGGAASVLLRKPRSHAEVYNDLDGDVVNLFRVIRGPDAGELVRQLRMTPFSEIEFFGAYEESECPIERARRLVVRSFMGFGSNAAAKKSGFRSNSNRSGTTPARDWMNYPNALEKIIERTRGVVIMSRDAKAVMAAHDSDEALHYVDPPYLPETRDKGGDYAHEMTPEQHDELLEFLQSLRGRVILSGYPSQKYDDALRKWRRVEMDAMADGARPRKEVLWMNFEAKAEEEQIEMFA